MLTGYSPRQTLAAQTALSAIALGSGIGGLGYVRKKYLDAFYPNRMKYRYKKNKKKNKRKYKSKARFSKPVTDLKSVKESVNILKRSVEADQGTLIYRFRRCMTARSAVNSCLITQGKPLNNVSNIEAVLAQLRYYDIATPDTLVQADGTTGTYRKDFNFNKSFHKIVIRNNYQVPCRVRAVIYKVKEDTSLTPPSCIINGLADVGNPSITSPLIYATDSEQLNEIWKSDESWSGILQPGSRKVITYSNKKFTYDPSITDNHALTYQRSFDGCYFSIRVEGVIGHDAVEDEEGTLQSGVDVQVDSSWEVLYPAGVNLKYIVVNDTSDSFTTGGATGGVVSQKPVADNLSYLIS